MPWRSSSVHPRFDHRLKQPKCYIPRTLQPKSIPTMWHYVCHLYGPWRQVRPCFDVDVLSLRIRRQTSFTWIVTWCTTFYWLRESGSNCHKPPGRPGGVFSCPSGDRFSMATVPYHMHCSLSKEILKNFLRLFCNSDLNMLESNWCKNHFWGWFLSMMR